ncbi:MAG: CARDB domain-containing protein, partial [Cystobacter sp.]
NNTRLSAAPVGIGYRADFVITSVKGPASVEGGQPLTAQVTVCNQGTQPDYTRVALLLSEDEHLEHPSSGPSQPQDALVSEMSTSWLDAGQCATLSLSGLAYPPPTNSPGVRGFHLGAVVNPEGLQPEFRTDNNTHPGYLLGVGNAPDFVITSVKGPASVEPGQSFTTQVTVCNQGTRPGDTRVHLLLSEDEHLRLPSPSGPPEDAPVGHAPVSWLNPGQCTPVSISGQAQPPAPGSPNVRAFHLGAVLDPTSSPDELRTDNNTHPGYLLGVGYGPDFVITSVKGPASVEPGQSFTTRVTVCNQGTRSGDSRVYLLLSSDTQFRLPWPGPSEDSLVGDMRVPPLNPGQCTPVSISGQAQPPAPGSPNVRTFHLGAVLDTRYAPEELRTDNDTHPGYLLGVGYGPDFVITSVKGPASMEHGQPFTAQVTVCNQGTRSEHTRVHLLLSRDEHIRLPSPSSPLEDLPVGEAPVPPLNPGQCTPVSISGNAYPPPGPSPDLRVFHLGAALDPNYAPDELRTDNNTHPGYLLGLGNGSDFVITSVKGPASVERGRMLTAQVTVCNQGTRPGDTRVHLLLSEDEHIRLPSPYGPFEDAPLGEARVSWLNPGRCTTVPISGNIQPPPGTGPDARVFHLGAALDPNYAPEELRTDNNTNPGYLLSVGDGPDFVISSVKGPASVEPSRPLTAQVTVCNQGTRPGDTRVHLLLSEDEHLRLPSPSSPFEDSPVGEAQVSWLQPGQCTTVSISGSAYPPPVTTPLNSWVFHLGAVVETRYSSEELRTDNNTNPGYLLGVGHGPDFVITAVKGPASVEPNRPLTAQVTVCNQGTGYGDGRVSLLLSEDEHIRLPSPSSPFEDSPVGDAELRMLAPGQCATVPVTGQAQPPPVYSPNVRAFHLGAAVETHSSPEELRTDNNTNVGYLLGVGQGPDFVITSVKGPASLDHNQSFTAQATVCNQGTRPGDSRLFLVLSEDEHLRPPSPSAPPEDAVLGELQLPPLAPGQCTTLSIPAQVQSLPVPPSPGTQVFHLGAVVETFSPDELRRDNNTHAGYLLSVGAAPDFVVTAVENPPFARAGTAFITQVTVCNQGTRAASTRVSVLLSADTTLRLPNTPFPSESEDIVLGEIPTGYLQPNWCETVSIPGTAWSPPPGNSNTPGLAYVGAVLTTESVDGELRTDNNSLLGGWMYIAP